MYKTWTMPSPPLSMLVRLAREADPQAQSVYEWMLSQTGLDKITLPQTIVCQSLRNKATKAIADFSPAAIRHARFHLARTNQIKAAGCVVGKSRFDRLQAILHAGVPPQVLREVILDRASCDPDAIEALGLLTALKQMRTPSHTPNDGVTE